MNRFLSRGRGLLVFGQVLTLLISCSSFGQENTPVGSGKSGITGRLVSKSDVMSMPDQPLRAMIIAIPGAKADSLLGNKGTGQGEGYRYARLFRPLSQADFKDFVASKTTSDKAGNYHLELSAGNWQICLCDPNEVDNPMKFPVTIYGCAQVQTIEGKSIEKRLSWGEAGFISK